MGDRGSVGEQRERKKAKVEKREVKKVSKERRLHMKRLDGIPECQK
jgi:hypothetical protein